MSIRMNLSEIFSKQEMQVLILYNQGLTPREIGDKIDRNRRHVNVVIDRIKKKIGEMESNDMIIDYSDNTFHLDVPNDEIREVFEEEQNRNIKMTMNLAKYLQNSDEMISKKKGSLTSTERVIRSRLGVKSKEKELVTRKWTDEEREEFMEVWHERQKIRKEKLNIKKDIYKTLRIYEAEMYAGSRDTERMASYERILRSYGLIYKTPYINKLNAKTGTCLRAVSSGKKVVIINDEDRDLLPQDAKHVETSTLDENEGTKESVWIVDKWK